MKFTWIGHSCFKVESCGSSIVLDPYRAGTVPGLRPVVEQADAVLCSHEHPDHNGREQVALTGRSCGLRVTTIQSYHDEVKGAKRGANQIVILEDGQTKAAHFGDIGCELEPEQMEQLKGLDVALIPVGGFFTIDGKQAAALAKALAPKVVIPMHYRMDGVGFDLIGTVEAFTKWMEPVTVTDASVYDTQQNLAGTVVLTPANHQ
ncbi:MAG: MBL fold metallo-hydrolase [Oscillospiraceae bacterium]|nr:MBL fold metallo-hydrolase [Oscillospiraceae bacterium]